MYAGYPKDVALPHLLDSQPGPALLLSQSDNNSASVC